MSKTAKKYWYQYIPHPVVMLFGIILIATLLSHMLTAGTYERILVDGRQRVVPSTFQFIDSSPLSVMDMLRAFSKGFGKAHEVIWVVLTSGIMFGILEKTKMIEHVVGTLVKKMGTDKKELTIILMTVIFSLFGIFVGYENNIALVPIAAIMILAIGGDLMLAAGVSVAAITIGFGLSPINPYTVGTGHRIAELPLYSGAILRTILCSVAVLSLAFYNLKYYRKTLNDPAFSLTKNIKTIDLKLSKSIDAYQMSGHNYLMLGIFILGMGLMLFGIFQYGWFFKEISGIFILITIVASMFSRLTPNEIGQTVLKSVGIVAPGAFMVGFATTITIILQEGQISDTIAYYLSNGLSLFPSYISAVLMSGSQSILNFMIPSGSGQALATLPIMIPAGELAGMTRQCSILAFQIGDGVTNMINPTLGGLIAMLGLCRVPFDKWLQFIFPITMIILGISLCFLLLSVLIGWS